MTAEPNISNPPPAAESPGTAAPSGTQATPAPDAGEDVAALRAQLDAISKWKERAEADLKKYRDAKKEAEDRANAEKAELEKKAREAGDFAKLHDVEKERRLALEAQLADLAPKAERLTAHEKRMKDRLDAAKAKGDLPSYIVRAIDVAAARDVDEAIDILDEFRASLASQPAPAKQPAPPAPAQGAAPPSPPVPKKLEHMTTAELEQLKRTDRAAFDALIGAVNGSKQSRSFSGWFSGR